MMLDKEQLNNYIVENYVDVTDEFDDENHASGLCSNCKKVVGFQIIERMVAKCNIRRTPYADMYDSDYTPPYSIYFQCPICKMFKIWIVFDRHIKKQISVDGELKEKSFRRIFRVTSLPNEGVEEIEDLPNEPVSLRKAYTEAIKSLDNGCYLASAAMFRRALQIITRDILGATPDTLANELKSLVSVGKSNKLGIALTNDFASNGYIIKDCGNQGAHPDKDPDLLSFELTDAQSLYSIFLEIVSELFVAPKAAQKAKDDLLKRRKLI